MKLPYPFAKLCSRLDAEHLSTDMHAIDKKYWIPHPQNLHGCEQVNLACHSGNYNDQSKEGPTAITAALDPDSYLFNVIKAFSPVGQVKIMKLAAGCKIPQHIDVHPYWNERVRIHIPIVTNDNVIFHIGDGDCQMRPGELWVIDNSLPHSVHNGGETDRFHLVIDLTIDNYKNLLLGETKVLSFDDVFGFEFDEGMLKMIDEGLVNDTLLVTTGRNKRLLAIDFESHSMQILGMINPTGIAVDHDALEIADDVHLRSFRFIDGAYVQVHTQNVGDLQIHEMGIVNDSLFYINTQHNSLVEVVEGIHHYRWRSWGQVTSDTDAGHVNGFTVYPPHYNVYAGASEYDYVVTMVSTSNEPDAWRKDHSKGCLLHLNSGMILEDNLIFPHSPRVYGDDLIYFESGRGAIWRKHNWLGDGNSTLVRDSAEGFLRGSVIQDDILFAGVSKLRPSDAFNETPLSKTMQGKTSTCGIRVVDLKNPDNVGFIHLHGFSEISNIAITSFPVAFKSSSDNKSLFVNAEWWK